MKKVYFSKSNQCDPDEVAAVRKVLQSFDCTIEEFKGGVYSHNSINDCDIMLILPPVKPKAFTFSTRLGKGQISQIQHAFTYNDETFNFEGDSEIDVYIILDVQRDNLLLGEINDYNMDNPSNFTNAGICIWCDSTFISDILQIKPKIQHNLKNSFESCDAGTNHINNERRFHLGILSTLKSTKP